MNRICLKRLFPPGADIRTELTWLAWAFAAALLFSLSCPLRLWMELSDLRRNGWDPVSETWRSWARLADFSEILGTALIGFVIIALLAFALAALHYSGHYTGGSRSIYTMRRLPQRFELHLRCLAVPALTLLLSAALWFILLALYYALYITAAPEQLLQPGQWQHFWQTLL